MSKDIFKQSCNIFAVQQENDIIDRFIFKSERSNMCADFPELYTHFQI